MDTLEERVRRLEARDAAHTAILDRLMEGASGDLREMQYYLDDMARIARALENPTTPVPGGVL